MNDNENFYFTYLDAVLVTATFLLNIVINGHGYVPLVGPLET
jgi:hypothetical protein